MLLVSIVYFHILQITLLLLYNLTIRVINNKLQRSAGIKTLSTLQQTWLRTSITHYHLYLTELTQGWTFSREFLLLPILEREGKTPLLLLNLLESLLQLLLAARHLITKGWRSMSHPGLKSPTLKAANCHTRQSKRKRSGLVWRLTNRLTSRHP